MTQNLSRLSNVAEYLSLLLLPLAHSTYHDLPPKQCDFPDVETSAKGYANGPRLAKRWHKRGLAQTSNSVSGRGKRLPVQSGEWVTATVKWACRWTSYILECLQRGLARGSCCRSRRLGTEKGFRTRYHLVTVIRDPKSRE